MSDSPAAEIKRLQRENDELKGFVKRLVIVCAQMQHTQFETIRALTEREGTVSRTDQVNKAKSAHVQAIDGLDGIAEDLFVGETR